MKIFNRFMAGLASGIMIVGTINVYAQDNINTLPIIPVDLMKDSVHDVSDILHKITDDIDIQPVETEPSYVYVEEPAYSQVTYNVPVYQEDLTLTYDEFMSMYQDLVQEDVPETVVDTAIEQAAYDEALANYNTALAEYEAASQMIETTKEVEVEIVEDVTDEDGNVTEVTRTEIQTVTELIPAGDIDIAKANLDVASAALDFALQALETAQSQTIIVEQPKVEESAPIPSTIVEPEQQAIIEDDVVVTEEVTQANSGTCGDNLTWTLDDAGNLTISGTGEMERFNWYVDQKRPPWGTSVVNVIIQNGVTSIGDYAFQECKSLKNITLPDSITYISYNAFCSCSSLTNITIPNNVTSIEAYAFMDCSSLKTIAIPNNVTWLGEYAFGFCKSLTSITMSEGVTDIDDNAFVHCESLTSITIPSTVTYIGDNAFSWGFVKIIV